MPGHQGPASHDESSDRRYRASVEATPSSEDPLPPVPGDAAVLLQSSVPFSTAQPPPVSFVHPLFETPPKRKCRHSYAGGAGTPHTSTTARGRKNNPPGASRTRYRQPWLWAHRRRWRQQGQYDGSASRGILRKQRGASQYETSAWLAMGEEKEKGAQAEGMAHLKYVEDNEQAREGKVLRT